VAEVMESFVKAEFCDDINVILTMMILTICLLKISD